ncbi:hypothetical protein CALVIDRAFT_192584 [Calocera viscosa TUFC12733]|uniref:Uncharacterized protein n=1 Tax=Calocera viscosa (strain TUFC12733) TaxID=1330018 RepID=A0A167KPB8_CALVF|nr:hypothetical protein CALVIDRAFT_192584 [Calocera viscosa TUFC12733]
MNSRHCPRLPLSPLAVSRIPGASVAAVLALPNTHAAICSRMLPRPCCPHPLPGDRLGSEWTLAVKDGSSRKSLERCVPGCDPSCCDAGVSQPIPLRWLLAVRNGDDTRCPSSPTHGPLHMYLPTHSTCPAARLLLPCLGQGRCSPPKAPHSRPGS